VAPKERNLNDRIRNVASALPETQMAAVPAEISLFAWTERSLGSISVDGISPQRRDLTLVMAPLSAHLPAGSFTLPTGVLGARVTQVTAGDSTGGGCCPFDPRVQPIYVGPGGSVTFEFDIPAEHVHFRRLKLDVNAGGADSGDLGHVYNWQSRRWETVDLTFGEVSLHHPDQYLSPSGGLLLKLTPTLDSGAVAIGDVDQQLQLSGSGTVG
jgi:hypothetical protein